MNFSLGQVVMTAAIHRWSIEHETVPDILECLSRHSNGDWGEVDDEDKRANEAALKYGSRLLSAYTVGGRKIWIITEADRSSTTILFPEDY